MTRLVAVQCDITTLAEDAIVNAAASHLLGGSGVDGAIHRAAGPRLLEACRLLGGCPTGEARITPGFDLPCRFVIHTVGPIWGREQGREAELLASCYKSCLGLAVQNDLQTLAFPCISTGAYGYPKEAAAKTAISSVREFVSAYGGIQKVIFCVFSPADLDVYLDLLSI